MSEQTNAAPRSDGERERDAELIEALDRAAQDYCWERGLGAAAIEKQRLDAAKAELLSLVSDLREQNAARQAHDAQHVQPYIEKLEAELADLREQGRRERADVAKVLEAFDAGLFVRSTHGDGEMGWSMRFLPYVAALGRLSDAIDAAKSAAAFPLPETPDA